LKIDVVKYASQIIVIGWLGIALIPQKPGPVSPELATLTKPASPQLVPHEFLTIQ